MGLLKKLKKFLDINEPAAKGGGTPEGSEPNPRANGSTDGSAGGARLPAVNQPGYRRAETVDISTGASSGAASAQAPVRQVTFTPGAPIGTPPSAVARSGLKAEGNSTQASAPVSPALRPGGPVASPAGAAGATRTSLSGKGNRVSTDEPTSVTAADKLRTAQSGTLTGGRGSAATPSARVSNAGNGGLPSINDSNSSLSSIMSNKMKNMVFVEAPATIEIESGAEPLVLPGGPTPLPNAGGGANPYTISTAAAAKLDAKTYRRVQRIRSLPMLIDTNPLHHHALHVQATALKGGIVTIPSNDAIGNIEAMAAAKQLHDADERIAAEAATEALRQQAMGAAAAQAAAQGKRRRAPRRHASLKHLLNLDSYDFVTDVNVAEAQEEVESDGEGGAPVAPYKAHPNDPLAILQSMTQTMSDADYKESNILAVNKALPRGMKRSMWSVRDYTLSKKLHQGYASDVYFAKCNLTGELVVLKVYRLTDQCDLQRVQLYREIRVHSRLQHQNVVQFYAAFLEDNCVIIVQEYAAGGDLLRYMYKYGGRLTERQAVNLVLQPFLSALLYLHTQGIIHRDIKPENCLLTDSRLLKLADFGLAVDLNEERANTRAGTLDYMAPEVLRCPTKQTPDQFKSTPGAAHYQMGADAWAVGVFAYELIAGAPPFKAEQMIDTARNIISVNITYPSTISELARDFIAACLRKHPGDRPTVIEMLHHPWIQMFQRRASVRVPPVMGAFQPRGSTSGEASGHPGAAHSHLNPNLSLAPSGTASPRAQAQYVQQQAMQAAAYREQMQRKVGAMG